MSLGCMHADIYVICMRNPVVYLVSFVHFIHITVAGVFALLACDLLPCKQDFADTGQTYDRARRRACMPACHNRYC
eukprot:6192398-Pleurochrysis_carterae.AAC.2